MEGERFNRVAEVMARMAAGDRAAVFALYYEFGAPVGAALRRQLRAMGIERIRNEDLDGLVIDACMELETCAGAWSPTGGALPWTWAGARLRNVVTRYVGVHADPLDEQEAVDRAPLGERGAVEAAPGLDTEEVAVLAALAAIDDSCALLHEALAEVASPRDRALVLEFKVQADLGDPSPAVTVGRLHDMRPDAVRQAVKRTLDRLRDLARTEGRYHDLACLSILR